MTLAPGGHPAGQTGADVRSHVVWERIERAKAKGRTVTLKLRYADFRTLTRARSVTPQVADKAMFGRIGHALLEELMPLPQPVRLMGLTLSALEREPREEAMASRDGQLSLL